MSKRQLHISQINMAGMCLARFQYRYMDGIKRPPGFAAGRGTGTHKAIQENMVHKRDVGEMLPLEAVKDAARDATEAWYEDTLTYSDGPAMSEDEKERGAGALLAEAIDQAVILSELHYISLAPDIDPWRVEAPWVLELENYPVDLSGTIDLQESEADGRLLRDTKTTSKVIANAAETSEQLTMYAMASWKMDGSVPPLALDHLVIQKVLKVVTQHTNRTIDDFRVLLNRVEALVRAIEAGSFPPTNRNNWWCSPKFCGYFGGCKYVR